MSIPRFTIVTCCWNSEPYISQCIDSVRSQTYPFVQQVFVDGGSTDGTLDRLARLDGDVTILTGVRGGISKAMNTGILNATGDIVAHLHADDYYMDSNALAKVAEIMSRGDVRWLYGNIASNVNGKLVYPEWQAPAYSRSALLRRNFIPHPATFVQRSLFAECGVFDENLKYAMDYDLWLRLSRISSPHHLNEWIAIFRRHSGSASTSNARATFDEDQLVRLRHTQSEPLAQIYHKMIYRLRLWKYY